MRPKTLLFVAVALTWATFVSAEQPDPARTDASANAWEDYSPESILMALEIDHGLWLEAQLAGRREQAEQIGNELLSLVNRDIYAHQERVREMAKNVALASIPATDPADESPETDSLSERATFESSISRLNAKEALCRSMQKTDAFSNKYRLLGDYIDLLRRELEMPRLKLASSKASTDSKSESETTLKQR